MKVLHVIPSVSPVHGGPSKAIVEMEHALTERGVNVSTMTTDDDGTSRHLPRSERISVSHGAQRIYLHKSLDFYKVAPAAPAWLWRHVREFDAVHVHALFSFVSASAAHIARLRGVPYIVRPLGTIAQYGLTQRRPLLKRLSIVLNESPILRNADAVHFTSRAEMEEARLLGIDMHGVVIPLGMDAIECGNSDALIRQHPKLENSTVILFMSRLDPKKNVEGLLSAFASLKSQKLPGSLVVAGDGPPTYVNSLKDQSQQLGIKDDVVWLGHVDGVTKAAALAAADMFVLPSYSENYGIAAAEALMCGLPCILAQGVALSEDVRTAQAGLVVATDPQSITEAMVHLLGDPELRTRIGSRAKEFAMQNYSRRAMADKLIELYRPFVKEDRATQV